QYASDRLSPVLVISQIQFLRGPRLASHIPCTCHCEDSRNDLRSVLKDPALQIWELKLFGIAFIGVRCLGNEADTVTTSGEVSTYQQVVACSYPGGGILCLDVLGEPQ